MFGCQEAVDYVRRGAPEAQVWYFGAQPPEARIARLCERVIVEPHAFRLLLRAQSELWPVTVALAVAEWAGTQHQAWPLKLAPLLIPPFRALLRNEHGDYFAAKPRNLWRHLLERLKQGPFGGSGKVIAVFACEDAVAYARKGAPSVPVWYFGLTPPSPDVAGRCERVFAAPSGWALLRLARRELGPKRVALAIAPWNQGGEPWAVKLAPFFFPPFRTLFHNESGDYFAGWPPAILRHLMRRARDRVHSGLNRLRDWGRGLWLLLLTGLAVAFGFAFRYAFRRRSASESLEVEPARPGEGLAVFRYGHRTWNRAELERIIGDRTLRWILFLEGGAGPDAEDLKELFDDARTFAVSRQAAYRDWRGEMLFTAPFRALQPGEFSQTLAPVSGVVLVDRAKLAALGVPRALTPISSWLLLFWQASAAGWRSYSVGGTRELLPSVEWPLEEADFSARRLHGASLRGLAPREPDLSRGSIAQARLAPAVRGNGRPRVLVVSPYLPFPLSHGGAVRIYNLCRTLGDRVDFLLASFREKNDRVDYDKLHEVFREVYIVDREERARADAALPAQVCEHESRSMRALVEMLCRERAVDAVQVEYTHMARFRPKDVPSILVEHDLTFSLCRQLGRDAEEARWLAFERDCFREFDAVWTMSSEDRAAAIAEGSAAERTWTVPNGVDVRRFSPRGEPGSALEVFYVGSFRHLPNVIGFDQLVAEVMPRVWERCPEARLRVVAGPDYEKYRRPAAHPRVEVHGFVEDLRPLYAQAGVVVVPLLVSAGTNIKVMEAMASGNAVVSTPVGCAGLGVVDGEDILIREEWAAFADAAVMVLSDAGRRAAIAASARRTVERRFSWDAVADEAWDSYARLVGTAVR